MLGLWNRENQPPGWLMACYNYRDGVTGRVGFIPSTPSYHCWSDATLTCQHWKHISAARSPSTGNKCCSERCPLINVLRNKSSENGSVLGARDSCMCCRAACVRKGSSCAPFAQLGLEHLTLDGKTGFQMRNLRLCIGCFDEDTTASHTVSEQKRAAEWHGLCFGVMWHTFAWGTWLGTCMIGTCWCVGAVTDVPGYVKPAPLAASLRTAGKPTRANLSERDREAWNEFKVGPFVWIRINVQSCLPFSLQKAFPWSQHWRVQGLQFGSPHPFPLHWPWQWQEGQMVQSAFPVSR